MFYINSWLDIHIVSFCKDGFDKFYNYGSLQTIFSAYLSSSWAYVSSIHFSLEVNLLQNDMMIKAISQTTKEFLIFIF
jgi:hypothetical protein